MQFSSTCARLQPMATSKPHVAAVAGLGALLPFIPDLVKMLGLPAPVSNALCAVILAVAYAMIPKKKAEASDEAEAGYLRSDVLAVVLCLAVLEACAAIETAAKDAPKQDPET